MLAAPNQVVFQPLCSCDRLLLEGFDCRVDAAGPERQAKADTVAIPHYGVWVNHICGKRAVADCNSAVFHNGGETYQASHPYGCGDGGIVLRLERSLTLEIVTAHDPTAAGRPDRPFGFLHAPLSHAAHLASRRLAHMAAHDRLDALTFQETALCLVDEAVRSGVASSSGGSQDRTIGAKRAEELAFNVRGLLARRFAEPLSLDEIAREVGVSMFHLCRVFRRATGSSIHQHRDALRLRASLGLLADAPKLNMAQVALRVGYSNQSHFGAAFLRAFGATPTSHRRSMLGARAGA